MLSKTKLKLSLARLSWTLALRFQTLIANLTESSSKDQCALNEDVLFVKRSKNEIDTLHMGDTFLKSSINVVGP